MTRGIARVTISATFDFELDELAPIDDDDYVMSDEELVETAKDSLANLPHWALESKIERM